MRILILMLFFTACSSRQKDPKLDFIRLCEIASQDKWSSYSDPIIRAVEFSEEALRSFQTEFAHDSFRAASMADGMEKWRLIQGAAEESGIAHYSCPRLLRILTDK
jgi:hypothetical protein